MMQSPSFMVGGQLRVLCPSSYLKPGESCVVSFYFPGKHAHLSSLAPIIYQFRSAKSLNHVWLFATPWTAACQASLSINSSQSLLKLMSTESVMPSNHLILCCSLLLLLSIFPSIRVFSSESVLLIRWPKYSSFSFSISPSKEYSGLISFRMDWFDLLAIQGTLQECAPTPQFKSINSLALSFLYSPTLTSIRDYWKTIALTRLDITLLAK